MHAYEEAVSGHMVTYAGNTENFTQQGFLWRTSNVMKSWPMGTLHFDCFFSILYSLKLCISVYPTDSMKTLNLSLKITQLKFYYNS